MINQKSKTYIIWDIHITDKHKKKKETNTTKSCYTVAASFPSMACRWKKKI
jgi:hypothetical protein